MATCISFLFALLFFFGQTFLYAAENQKLSIQEIYELQERCGKSSAEFFKKMYGTGYDFASGGLTHHYESHYNKKLNKCFIRIMTFLIREKETEQVMLELYDVQENLQYGIFFESSEKMDCLFWGMKCNSKSNWNLLAKPYMEE